MIDFTDIECKIHCQYTSLTNTPPIKFHLHNEYEIYVLLSGNVHYFVEHTKYIIKRGDVLIFNSSEVHRPTFLNFDIPYSRYTIHFDPSFLSNYSCSEFRLLSCFEDRAIGEGNILRLSEKPFSLLTSYIESMINIRSQKVKGWEIEYYSVFLQLLVLLQREYKQYGNTETNHVNQLSEPLFEIIEYINDNLQNDLSLQSLEKKFFINKNYLCKLFREQTGNTIHNYINHKRIALAKNYLTNGSSVTDACHLSGFNDYSNFIRLFKQTTGFSPAKYRANMQQ